MHNRRSRSLLAVSLVATVALAACGSSAKKSSTTEGATTTAASSASGASTTAGGATTTGGSTPASGSGAGAGGTASLKGDCPDTVVIQTDWVPEAEHGFLYNMIGDGYSIDKSKGTITGPLVNAKGTDTGVKFQIRSGGAATGFKSDTDLMYTDDSILLGFVYTDEAIQNSAASPTVAIESGFEKNPQMIMWDPATYPDVTGIKDLGTKKVKVRYFGGAAYMDYFTSTGILAKDQVDGSYKGDPSLFVADEGKSAQQGFGSAEPYQYLNLIDGWKKPVKYQYINDVGWKNYAESIATKPANITKYAACFKKLVPIIQQSEIDYLNKPTHGNKLILDAVAGFGGNFGWTYPQGSADFGVKVMKDDKLVANGTDGTMGSFDMARITDLITKAIPVYTAQDSPPKKGLKAEDLVTSQFIDPSIKL